MILSELLLTNLLPLSYEESKRLVVKSIIGGQGAFTAQVMENKLANNAGNELKNG
jgi:hypothetical protein